MGEVLIKALGFVIVIIIGYICKILKILEKDDGYTISKVVMNITLPCALFTNATGATFNFTMLLVLLAGIILNFFMIGIGGIVSKTIDSYKKAAYMICCSGYNIGNFVMAFCQTFFPGIGLTYLCMFDIGNSMMCLGGTYALALVVANEGEKLSFRSLILCLRASVPFMCYMLVLFMTIFKLTLPSEVLSITSYIANANGFLVMLMIGLLLEIKVKQEEMIDVVKILLTRYSIGCILGLIVYYFLPLQLEIKYVIILALLSPLTTISPVFVKRCGYDKDAPALANSISIIISIIIFVFLLVLFVS